MLGLGALFLSFSIEYAPEVYSLLFGEVLGVSRNEIVPTAVLGLVCVAAIALIYRPLMLSSVLPEVGEARGVSAFRMELLFLVVVALAATHDRAGRRHAADLQPDDRRRRRPPARSPTARSWRWRLSVAFALVTVWSGDRRLLHDQLPVGFFVGTISAGAYALGRVWAAWRRRSASAHLGSLA